MLRRVFARLLAFFICTLVLQGAAFASIPTIVKSNVHVLNAPDTSRSVGIKISESALGRLKLSGAIPFLKKGDVIVSSEGQGLLQRVKRVVSRRNGQVELETEPGTLLDVFEQADIKITKRLGAKDFTSVQTKIPGVTYKGASSAVPTSSSAPALSHVVTKSTIDLPDLSFGWDFAPIDGGGGKIGLSGSISVQPVLEIEIRIRPFPPRLDYCRFVIRTTSTDNLTLSAQGNASFANYKKLYAVAMGATIPVPVGPVVIPVTPALGLYVQLNGSATLGLSYSLDVTTQSGGGFEYVYDRSPALTKVEVNDSSTAAGKLYANAEMSLSFTPARAEFTFYIFALKGPYLFANMPELTASVKAGTDLQDPTRICWDIGAKVAGGAAFDSNIFGIDFSNLNLSVGIETTSVSLLSDCIDPTQPAPTPQPTPTPRPINTLQVSPSGATVNAGSYQQFSVAAFDSTGASVPLSADRVTWSSAKPAVATIDATGKAQGVAPGICTLTARDMVSGKTATASFTVVYGPSVVTNTNADGYGSLHEAINYANVIPDTTITFRIPKTDSGFASGVFTINDGSLPSINQNTSLDGTTQTAFTGNTNASGPEVVLNAPLDMDSATLTLKGLTYNWNGGSFQGTGTVNADSSAQFNWTGGTNATATLSGTLNIPAGGTLNVISGNAQQGTLNNAGRVILRSGSAIYTNDGSMTINNSGTFEAQDNAMIHAQPGWPSAFNNTGTFNKSSGIGTVTLYQIALNNSGTVNVNSGLLELNCDYKNPPQSNQSGTFNTAAGATLDFACGKHNFNSGTVFTGSGLYRVNGGIGPSPNYGPLPVIINGIVLVNRGVTFDLYSGSLGGTQTLSGSGTIKWSGATLGGIITVAAGSTLNWTGGTNANACLSGTLNIPSGATLKVSNGGINKQIRGGILNNAGNLIWNDTNSLYFVDTFDGSRNLFVNSGTMTIQSDIYWWTDSFATSTFNNRGTITKTAGNDNSQLGVGAFNNSGTINCNAGLIDLGAAFKQTSGSTNLLGGNIGGTLNISGGAVSGAGIIEGTVNNTGGIINAGNTGVGILVVTGDYTQGASGRLEMDLGGRTAGTQFDQLQVTGKATLNGTLKANFINGFVPKAGDAFRVLTHGTRAGAFATVTVPDVGTAKSLAPLYSATATDLVFQNIALSINDVSLAEGSSGTKNMAFTVKLAAPSAQTVTVQYATVNGTATAPADYNTTNGTLSFAPGEVSKTITVPIVGDALNEANEVFRINLSVPTNATLDKAQGIGTVIDDDALPVLSSSNITVVEGSGGTKSAEFTVTLSAPSGRTVGLTCNTADGTARTPADYTAARINLSIPVGQTSAKFSVPITTDSTDEIDELFYAFLTAPLNAKISTARVTATLTDDDAAPLVSIGEASAKEYNGGTTQATFHINLSQPSGKVVKVTLSTANRTAGAGIFPATANGDYVPIAATAPVVVSISAGSTVGIAHVTINGDTLEEENETFLAKISAPENATLDTTKSSAIGTIIDDDAAPTVSIDDVSIAEGNSGSKNLVFTVTLSALSGKTVTVNYATANGTALSTSDYTVKRGTLRFDPGSAPTRTISIPIAGDTVAEGDETVFVLLSGAVNASISKARGVGTITNDDASG